MAEISKIKLPSGAIDDKLSYMTTTEVTSCVNTIFN